VKQWLSVQHESLRRQESVVNFRLSILDWGGERNDETNVCLPGDWPNRHFVPFGPCAAGGRIESLNNFKLWFADFGIKRKWGLLDYQESAKGAGLDKSRTRRGISLSQLTRSYIDIGWNF
jgi:hypothetical protein